jgi:hypothetical protein
LQITFAECAFFYIKSFFQLIVEVNLHHLGAPVARALATPVAGLLESVDGVNRRDAETQSWTTKHAKTFLTRIARINANQRAERPEENRPGQRIFPTG